MKDFKGGKRFGGGSDRPRSNFGSGNKRFGNDRGGDREMYTATCSECGKRCEVPFRPTGEKPVYCNDCFGSKRDGSFGNDRGGSSDRGNRGGDRPRRDFAEKPTYSKPAGGGDDKAIFELKKQIDTISSKLDAVIKMIQSTPFPTAVPQSKDSLKTIVNKAQATKSAPVKVAKPKAIAPTKKVEVKKAPAKVVAKSAPKKVEAKKVTAKPAAKKSVPKKK